MALTSVPLRATCVTWLLLTLLAHGGTWQGATLKLLLGSDLRIIWHEPSGVWYVVEPSGVWYVVKRIGCVYAAAFLGPTVEPSFSLSVHPA